MLSPLPGDTRRRARKRGHGEGTIGQRPDGRWYAQVMVGYKPDGKKDVRTVYGKTRGGCQQKLDELRKRAGGGLLPEAGKDHNTLGVFLKDWLEAAHGTVRTSTLDAYRHYVNKHLIPGLGRSRLAALKPDAIRRFYRAKGEEGLSPRTVHHLHAILHKALHDAVLWNYVPANPCDRVKAPTVPRKEIEPPAFADLARLLDAAEAAGDRHAALWTTAVYSGCRQGELLGLHWGDLDLDVGTLSVRRTLAKATGGVPMYGEPKTSSSRRTIRIAPEAAAGLKAHRDRQDFERRRLGEAWPDYGLVFTSVVGTPLDRRNVTRHFKAALKRAGLRESVRFHDLRHAAATLMLEAGVDTKIASARLGHSTTAITQDLYQHWIRSLDDQAAERMQRALRGAI